MVDLCSGEVVATDLYYGHTMSEMGDVDRLILAPRLILPESCTCACHLLLLHFLRRKVHPSIADTIDVKLGVYDDGH